MKIFLMSVLLLSAACSSHDEPTPRPLVMIRPTVELVAVTVTGLAPMSTRPNLSLRVVSAADNTRLLYQCPTTVTSAPIPSRFWIPGSYKGNEPFVVVLTNNGQPMSSVLVDPEQFKGEHRFNIGEGNTDLTVELSF